MGPRSRRAGALLGAAGFSLIAAGCGRSAPDGGGAVGRGGAVSPGVSAAAGTLSDRSRQQVERFCGDCHRLPLAESFPREDWPREVRQGYDFYLASLRSDLPQPPEADAIRYFQQGAPERWDVPRAAERSEATAPVEFVPVGMSAEAETADPAVAQVFVVGPRENGAAGIELVTTDMRSGEIRTWAVDAGGGRGRLLAKLSHPCRLAPLGATGRDGWLAGELGSFLPEDHDEGGVFLLGGAPQGVGSEGDPSGSGPRGLLPSRALRRGLGRVVAAIPFEAGIDGRDEIVVAEFGWRASGSLRLLPREGEPAEERLLDRRHGAIEVRLADLDGDGRRDIVAAFAQEHETVDAWFSRDSGDFEHRELHRFQDPSWGTSGFDLADMDADGDLDILHCNGDTMDSGLPRPTHGIRILVNDGSGNFTREDVAVMPGVSQAVAADCDGDGDLDVVAAALLPNASSHPAGTFDALLWVERAEDGTWRTHSIERDGCDFATVAPADVDGDGRLDLVAGVWLPAASGDRRPAIRVWLNRASSP